MLVKRTPHSFERPANKIVIAGRYIVLVDPEDFVSLNRYYWRVVRSNSCLYAIRREIRNGRTFTVRMHRQITNCPPGLEVHHRNGNTLDNRRCNLINLTPAEHSNFL